MKKTVYYSLCLLIYFITSCNFHQGKKNKVSFDYNGLIYIKCKINDSIEGNFIFDTGAYGLFLDSTFNVSRGLSNTILWFNPDSIRKSNLRFKFDTITYSPEIISTYDFKKIFGKDCDGVVGWDLFKNKILEINYNDSCINFIDSNYILHNDSFNKIPMVLKNQFFYVNTAVIPYKNIMINGEWLFDTGYMGSLLLTNKITDKYKIDSLNFEKFRASESFLDVTNYKSKGGIFRGKSIKLGKFLLTDPLIEYSIGRKVLFDSASYLGLMGNRTFEKFKMIIDFKYHNLYLKESSCYNEKSKFKTFGFGFIDRTDICEGYIITSVLVDFEAAKAGIKSGDIITHINGRSIKDYSKKEKKDIFKKVGEEFIFTIKRESNNFRFKLKLTEQLKDINN
ncbi:MAG: PDZ domain-containing protein [Bacteroidota bacterium]|nr:PDZ domain-containing protein [Bacteroidota bacterium]